MDCMQSFREKFYIEEFAYIWIKKIIDKKTKVGALMPEIEMTALIQNLLLVA